MVPEDCFDLPSSNHWGPREELEGAPQIPQLLRLAEEETSRALRASTQKVNIHLPVRDLVHGEALPAEPLEDLVQPLLRRHPRRGQDREVITVRHGDAPEQVLRRGPGAHETSFGTETTFTGRFLMYLLYYPKRPGKTHR